MSFNPARLTTRLATIVVAALVVAALAPLSLTPAHAERWRIPSSSAQVSPRASLAEFEIQVMNRINEVRSAAGLRKIGRFDSCVDRMSEAWATRLAGTGVLEHRAQRQVLQRCNQSWAGENLVSGTRLTPNGAVDAWLASPGHREIMMKPRARLAGVAFERDSRGRYVGVLNVTDPG